MVSSSLITNDFLIFLPKTFNTKDLLELDKPLIHKSVTICFIIYVKY